MKAFNFIPADRRRARRQKRRWHLWLCGLCAYATALLAAYSGACGLWGGQQSLAGELDQARTQIQRAKRGLAATGEQLAASASALMAKQVVGRQPDWSLLLALTADSLGDEVVLRQLELRPERPPAAAPSAANAPDHAGGSMPLVLKLTGYGKTQAAVAAFVLRLERTELFEQVKLVKTAREPFLSAHAIGFQVDCWLGSKAEGSQ